jgi:hypothetical protein
MSLAEELYADLDDDADELDLDLKKEEDDVIDEVTEELPNTKFYETIRDVAKLTGSTKYNNFKEKTLNRH